MGEKTSLHQDDLLRRLYRTHLEWPSKIFRVGSYFSECPVMRMNICHREDRVTPLITLLQGNRFLKNVFNSKILLVNSS